MANSDAGENNIVDNPFGDDSESSDSPSDSSISSPETPKKKRKRDVLPPNIPRAPMKKKVKLTFDTDYAEVGDVDREKRIEKNEQRLKILEFKKRKIEYWHKHYENKIDNDKQLLVGYNKALAQTQLKISTRTKVMNIDIKKNEELVASKVPIIQEICEVLADNIKLKNARAEEEKDLNTQVKNLESVLYHVKPVPFEEKLRKAFDEPDYTKYEHA